MEKFLFCGVFGFVCVCGFFFRRFYFLECVGCEVFLFFFWVFLYGNLWYLEFWVVFEVFGVVFVSEWMVVGVGECVVFGFSDVVCGVFLVWCVGCSFRVWFYLECVWGWLSWGGWGWGWGGWICGWICRDVLSDFCVFWVGLCCSFGEVCRFCWVVNIKV